MYGFCKCGYYGDLTDHQGKCPREKKKKVEELLKLWNPKGYFDCYHLENGKVVNHWTELDD